MRYMGMSVFGLWVHGLLSAIVLQWDVVATEILFSRGPGKVLQEGDMKGAVNFIQPRSKCSTRRRHPISSTPLNTAAAAGEAYVRAFRGLRV